MVGRIRDTPYVRDDDRVCDCVVGYTVDTLQYGWLDEPVDIDKSLQISQFTLEKHEKHDCSQNYTAGSSLSLPLSVCLPASLCPQRLIMPPPLG